MKKHKVLRIAWFGEKIDGEMRSVWESLNCIKSYIMPPLVKVMLLKKLSKWSGRTPLSYRDNISVNTESPMSWLTMWALLRRTVTSFSSTWPYLLDPKFHPELNSLFSLIHKWVGVVNRLVWKPKPKMVENHHLVPLSQRWYCLLIIITWCRKTMYQNDCFRSCTLKSKLLKNSIQKLPFSYLW